MGEEEPRSLPLASVSEPFVEPSVVILTGLLQPRSGSVDSM
jgi:hypothetical protein